VEKAELKKKMARLTTYIDSLKGEATGGKKEKG
jgi:hypothetical protein